MRTDTEQLHGTINNIFLPGMILLANIDVSGILEYALRALAGGGIWLGYKMIADLIERKRASKPPMKGKNTKGIKKSDNNVG